MAARRFRVRFPEGEDGDAIAASILARAGPRGVEGALTAKRELERDGPLPEDVLGLLDRRVELAGVDLRCGVWRLLVGCEPRARDRARSGAARPCRGVGPDDLRPAHGPPRMAGRSAMSRDAFTLHPDDDPRWARLAADPAVEKHLAAHATSNGLATALADLRHAAGLGVRELAAHAAWDPATVTRVETGLGRVPTLASIQRFAATCGATVELVLRGPGGERVVPLGEDLQGRATRPAVERTRRPRVRAARKADAKPARPAAEGRAVR